MLPVATEHIVQLLIQERDRLTRAIEALQGPTKRRGRPPEALSEDGGGSGVNGGAPKKRTWSAAQKKAAAERMKARWAAKKKGK